MNDPCIETKLNDTLLFLNCALTGKSEKEACRSLTDSNLSNLLVGQEFYLSDGGYSRLVVSVVNGTAFLTDNSRQEVKEAWNRCKELIADFETLTFKTRQLKGFDC